ncbi:MAG: FecR domain-containing protein [Burkholderiales bacterium]
MTFVTGDVWLVDASRKSRRPALGAHLYVHDTIFTGKDGEVHLDMEDGAYLAVRSNTLLKVKEYRAQGDKNDRGVLNLLKGTFRSFTGWIARSSPKAYRVETVTATIGVRGTDHEPLLLLEEISIGKPGTYDKVNEGVTFIDHPSGQVEVKANQAGFAPLSRSDKAVLLQFIPEFFRSSVNEGLLSGRHKIVQDNLEQRLETRRRSSNSQSGDPESNQDLKQEPNGGELQETPLDENPGSGLQEAPTSSGIPGSAAVPASAVSTGASVLSVPAPAVPAVSAPGVPSVPASSVKPGVSPRSAPAGAENLPAKEAPVVQPPVASSAAEKSPLPSRGEPATLETPVNQMRVSPPDDRSKAYNELRKKRQEDYRKVYEQERERERALEAAREAERMEMLRKREQR